MIKNHDTRSFRQVTRVIRLAVVFWIAPAFLLGAGYEFEGVGARQVSRAGAAIADSDDWTAIYWNPGNIVRSARKSGAEFGAEIFGGEVFGKDSNSLSSLAGPLFAKEDIRSHFILGAIGFVLPVGDRFALGGGFYTPLLQGANFKDTSPAGLTLDLKNSAAILTWTLSGSFEIIPDLSAGAGLDLLYGRFSSEATFVNFPLATNTSVSDVEGDGLALEGIFGLRYDPNRFLSLGAVYRSGGDVKITGEASVENSLSLPPFIVDEKTRFSYELRHPPTWGVGTAYRPTGKFTVTLDYNRTLWHRFISNIVYDTPGPLLVNGANTFNWKDSWRVRLGSSYKLTDKTECQAGWSYDSVALDAGSLDLATTVDVPLHSLGIGVSHLWGDRLETSLGWHGGLGTRNEGGVTYRLSGYQIMLETRFTISR